MSLVVIYVQNIKSLEAKNCLCEGEEVQNLCLQGGWCKLTLYSYGLPRDRKSGTIEWYLRWTKSGHTMKGNEEIGHKECCWKEIKMNAPRKIVGKTKVHRINLYTGITIKPEGSPDARFKEEYLLYNRMENILKIPR